jgi:hypothetical protein
MKRKKKEKKKEERKKERRKVTLSNKSAGPARNQDSPTSHKFSRWNCMLFKTAVACSVLKPS